MASLKGLPKKWQRWRVKLENVRTRFQKLHRTLAYLAAFQSLIAMAKSATAMGFWLSPFAPAIDFDGEPSTLQLVKELRSWVDTQQGSREYADIAKKASNCRCEVLYGDLSSGQILVRAVKFQGYSAKLHCARCLHRMDREASAALTGSSARERDHLGICDCAKHIDGVSNYAFASRITSVFRGWLVQQPCPREVSLSRGIRSVSFYSFRYIAGTVAATDVEG